MKPGTGGGTALRNVRLVIAFRFVRFLGVWSSHSNFFHSYHLSDFYIDQQTLFNLAFND
jgi:hypothetical protein